MEFSLIRWNHLRAATFLLIGALVLSGCAQERKAADIGCKNSAIPCLTGTVLVSLETERGTVLLNIDGINAPMTAGNFVDLVNRGVYNGTIFHRVVRKPLPFVVQGGDPNTANSKTPLGAYGTGNFINPTTGEVRFVPLEFRLKSTNALQYGVEISSPALIGQLKLTHERGAVAMARSADPNSASAQFYIALEALPELDGHYAVFGRVVQGMDVVDRIQQGDKLIRAKIKRS